MVNLPRRMHVPLCPPDDNIHITDKVHTLSQHLPRFVPLLSLTSFTAREWFYPMTGSPANATYMNKPNIIFKEYDISFANTRRGHPLKQLPMSDRCNCIISRPFINTIIPSAPFKTVLQSGHCSRPPPANLNGRYLPGTRWAGPVKDSTSPGRFHRALGPK
jgi:hypothetical protein